MRRFIAIMVMLVGFTAFLPMSSAELDNVVFGCNYTISMSIGGEEFEVSHQDRVRSGSAIPFEMQGLMLRLRVSEASTESAKVEFVLLEKSDDDWHEIYVSPPSFEAKYGTPTEFKFQDDIVTIAAYLSVSIVMS